MEFLSRYFAQIKNQLSALTISQRLLIGALVVIMLGTTFFVVFLSRTPDMVEVLPQSLSPEEVSKMADYLKVHGYTYKVMGDKVMVPLETVQQVRGELAGAQVFPRDTTAAFTKILSDSNFLMSDTQHERRYTIGLQGLLADLIGHFDYIREATVVIDKGDHASLGRDERPGSAMITVRLKGQDSLTSTQVSAIADTVAGAVAGLRRENIHIIDGNRSYSVSDKSIGAASDILEQKVQTERYYINSLKEIFSDIPNIKIAVGWTPDWSRKTTSSTTPDAKTTLVRPKEETSHETTTSEGSAISGEPGVKSNLSANVQGSSSGNKSTSSSTDTTTSNEIIPSIVTTNISYTPGAETKDLSASIIIPRSYLVAVHRRAVKDEKAEPDDATLEKIFTKVKDQMTPLAKTAINANSVAVGWFDDVVVQSSMLVGGSGGAANGSTSSVGVMLSQYGKQAILGIVAVGALGMMLMMVRKAAPGVAGGDLSVDVLTGGVGKGRRGANGDPGALDVDDDVIGEAGSGEAVLTGIELDDQTLASRKIVDEVSVMIKENPENAASLVKRWMTKGK